MVRCRFHELTASMGDAIYLMEQVWGKTRLAALARSYKPFFALVLLVHERKAELARIAPGHPQAARNRATAQHLHGLDHALDRRGALPFGQISVSGRTIPLASG